MMISNRILFIALTAIGITTCIKAQEEVGIWDRFETSVINAKHYADPYRDTDARGKGWETLWSGNKSHAGYNDDQLRKNAIAPGQQ